MSNCMLFENNLMTMVCLGEVLLIFCHLLPIVGKTDSESNTLNTVMEFNRTDNQIVDKKTLRIFMNNNPTTKRLLINTQRKKINFENLLNKYHNKPINITSTCTPFFVQKTKMAHRKKQRLKKPIGMSTGKTIDPPSTESLQDKGKIIHSKHSTAYFSAASSSSTSDDKIMQKKKISNTIDLLKSCLPKNRSYIESGLSYDGLSNTPLNGNQITLDPRTVKYNITSGTKMYSATRESLLSLKHKSHLLQFRTFSTKNVGLSLKFL
ncbi:uncharacterized protein LOC128985004 [Macrosteles quadrilineatus]|uniref:uncharacterized protein LOC128985004 n=1 Tax=Macrosteles quadrilineatus TaxID=74068 RepID=UPI0023E3121A|nr:uncharacterized protein LOC128985004 [Macrosteles quadrilineatus]